MAMHQERSALQGVNGTGLWRKERMGGYAQCMRKECYIKSVGGR